MRTSTEPRGGDARGVGRPSLSGRSPALVIDTYNIDIDGYKPEDFAIVGYEHHDHVPLSVAV